MHAVEAHEQGVGVGGQVLHVLGHDVAQQHALLLGLRLNHVTAVVRVEEELTGLGVCDKLDVVEVTCVEKGLEWMGQSRG